MAVPAGRFVNARWWPAVSSEPSHRRRPGRPRKPVLTERIVVSAADLLVQRGFDKMTVDAVAAAAGVGKATIYRRWSSKVELAHHAMDHLLGGEASDVDTGTLRGDLEQACRAALEFATSPRGTGFIRLALTEASRDFEVAAMYAAFIARRTQGVAAALDRARRRGEPVRPDASPQLYVELIAGVLVTRAITDSPIPPADCAAALVDLVLHWAMPTAERCGSDTAASAAN